MRLGRARSLALLACGVAVPLLAACGDADAVGGRTGIEILGDTRGAVRAAHSYHLVYDQTDTTGTTTRFDLSIAGPGSVSGNLTLSGARLDIVVTAGQAYVHGRDFFEKTAGASAAGLIGDQWVLLTPAQAAQFTGVLDLFSDTHKLADCLLGASKHGALTTATVTYNGQAVAEVKDAGDVAGDAPAVLDVAAGTPAYPLRLQTLGPRKPGGAGAPDVCKPPSPSPAPGPSANATATSATQRADAVFDRWDQAITVTPPPNPLDLGKLGG